MQSKVESKTFNIARNVIASSSHNDDMIHSVELRFRSGTLQREKERGQQDNTTLKVVSVPKHLDGIAIVAPFLSSILAIVKYICMDTWLQNVPSFLYIHAHVRTYIHTRIHHESVTGYTLRLLLLLLSRGRI